MHTSNYLRHAAVGVGLLAGVIGCTAPADIPAELAGVPVAAAAVEEAPVDPTAIRPFSIAVSDAVLDDLQARLANTRLPDQLDDADWDYGTELGYLTELIR